MEVATDAAPGSDVLGSDVPEPDGFEPEFGVTADAIPFTNNGAPMANTATGMATPSTRLQRG